MTASGSYAIGVDVGTGSVRCMIFDDRWTPVVQCQKAIRVSVCEQRSSLSRASVSLDISFIVRSARIRTIVDGYLASHLLLRPQMLRRRVV